jgi:hypothetical protein
MAINTANLSAFYNLENANDNSGTGLNLTNNNTVTFSAAKIINGGNFNGSNQYLSRTYTAALNLGTGDWTVGGWFYGDTFASRDYHMTGMGWDDIAANHLYAIVITGGSTLRLQWYNAGVKTLVHGATINTSTWYFVCARNISGTMSLSLNAGTPVTTAGTLQSTSAGGFAIGLGGPAAGAFWDGQLDAWGYWKGYALSDAEVIEWYNGGTGQQFPFVVPTNIKTWDGVARANVKTLLGVASANIKTINGIA